MAAGLYRSRDPKLRDFLKHVETEDQDCWTKLSKRLRASSPELLEQIVEPLWNTGDKLLRVNIVRHLDASRKDEHDLLTRLSRRLDPRIDAPELAAIARSGTTKAIERLVKRNDVPEPIRNVARHRLVVLAQEAADAAAATHAAAPLAQPPPATPVPIMPQPPVGGRRVGNPRARKFRGTDSRGGRPGTARVSRDGARVRRHRAFLKTTPDDGGRPPEDPRQHPRHHGGRQARPYGRVHRLDRVT